MPHDPSKAGRVFARGRSAPFDTRAHMPRARPRAVPPRVQTQNPREAIASIHVAPHLPRANPAPRPAPPHPRRARTRGALYSRARAATRVRSHPCAQPPVCAWPPVRSRCKPSRSLALYTPFGSPHIARTPPTYPLHALSSRPGPPVVIEQDVDLRLEPHARRLLGVPLLGLVREALAVW